MRMDGGIVQASAVAPLLDVDFSTYALSTGANSATLNAAIAAVGGYFTRASAASVQTSASAMVTTGIAVDDARIGNAGYGRGLVLERARTQLAPLITTPGEYTVYNCADNGLVDVGPNGSTLSREMVVVACPNPGDASCLYKGTAVSSATLHVASAWYKGEVGGEATYLQFANNGGSLRQSTACALTTSWQRFQAAKVTSDYPGSVNWFIEMGTDRGDPAQGATLAATINLAYPQIENSWCATEWVSSGTCAVDRHGFNSTTPLLSSNRVGLELSMIMKYASSVIPVGSKVALWSVDANNRCYVENAAGTLVVHCTVAGVDYAAAVAPAWSQYDLVTFWCAAGGGATPTKLAYRIGGGAEIVIGVSGAAQGTIPSGVPIDICHFAGADAHYLWLQRETFYAGGEKPSWVS